MLLSLFSSLLVTLRLVVATTTSVILENAFLQKNILLQGFWPLKTSLKLLARKLCISR